MSDNKKIRIAQATLLTFVALSMSMAIAHLLEMPTRLDYPLELWVEVTFVRGTYRMFGPPVRAAIEGVAWIAACVYAFNAWRCHGNWKPAAGAAFLMVSAHAVWWSFVFPANLAFAQIAPSIPADGASLRLQWEISHAVRALLQFAAFIVLAITFTRAR